MLELGYLITFAAYGIGLLLSSVLAAYLVLTLLKCGKKATATRLVIASSLLVFCLFFPARLIWNTRLAAVPGLYRRDGVRGTVTLNLKNDGSFDESWQRLNEYSGKPEADGRTSGSWSDHGRDWATRNLILSGFTLATQQSTSAESCDCNFQVRGYGGLTSIELGPGSDFVLYRQDERSTR